MRIRFCTAWPLVQRPIIAVKRSKRFPEPTIALQQLPAGKEPYRCTPCEENSRTDEGYPFIKSQDTFFKDPQVMVGSSILNPKFQKPEALSPKRRETEDRNVPFTLAPAGKVHGSAQLNLRICTRDALDVYGNPVQPPSDTTSLYSTWRDTRAEPATGAASVCPKSVWL